MENLTTLLQELATKLGTTTEYLWGVLIKQAAIAAYTNLSVIIFTILFGISILLTNRYYKKTAKYVNKDNNWTVETIVFMVVIFAILLIASAVCIPPMINGFFNPEYWALQEVLSVIK